MPITLDFTGKLVLITGGGRGIGWAITQSLAPGADVAITYTSKDPAEQATALSSEHGVKVRAFRCEVTRSADVDRMVGEVEQAYGKKVDIGIACAGITLWKAAHENTDDEFKQVFDVNTFGAYYLSRALVRSWLDLPVSVSETAATPPSKTSGLGKQLLFISSVSGLVAMRPQLQTAYNASKGAMTMMAKSLAAEWAPMGIMVNSISPGYVSTDMIANPPDEEAKQWAEVWKNSTPAGRFATAEEIGDCVALLVSDKQGGMGWMTGSDVVVDGGYTLW